MKKTAVLISMHLPENPAGLQVSELENVLFGRNKNILRL
jgi:hypothetical protein